MFGTLSRLLRNNDIIRIFAICQICILIFTIPVFASAPTQDVDDVIQSTYNFTVWTDYTQNFSIYYGDHEVNYSEALLNSIAQTLKYHGQGTSYHIITNSSSNGASPTYYISNFLEDVTWNQWKLNEQLKENKNAINSQIQASSGNITSTIGLGNNKLDTLIASNNSLVSNLTQISGTLGYQTTGNLVDIKNGISKLNSIDWINTNAIYLGCFDQPGGNQLSTYTAYPNRTDFYFKFQGLGSTYNADYVFFVKLPLYAWTGNNNINYIDIYSGSGNKINDNYYHSQYSVTAGGVYLNFSQGIQSNDFYIHLNVDPTFYLYNNSASILYLSYLSNDYYTVKDNILLEEIANKDFTATISDSDFTLLIPVLDPDVEFNMDIDLSLGDQDDVTDLINDTKDLTDTGTTVQQLLDTLNDVLELFFNQQNKNTVETISTQYHTYN